MVTIVVVEPDFDVRTLLAEWLAADGFTVDAFGHGPVAPEVLDSARALIVDLPSPRLQPSSPFTEMHARHPRLPVIGLSTSLGVSLGSDSTFACSLGLAGVLAKPCERRELLTAVHAVLDRRAA
jgi:two-component system OmpR family response regulator